MMNFKTILKSLKRLKGGEKIGWERRLWPRLLKKTMILLSRQLNNIILNFQTMKNTIIRTSPRKLNLKVLMLQSNKKIILHNKINKLRVQKTPTTINQRYSIDCIRKARRRRSTSLQSKSSKSLMNWKTVPFHHRFKVLGYNQLSKLISYSIRVHILMRVAIEEEEE